MSHMKRLREYDFQGEYSKLDNDVAEDFYMPCMRNSVQYDRLSGYFSSTIYILAWDALKIFIENGGHIRILCSPYLSEDDARAIARGKSARSNAILEQSLKKEIDGMLCQYDLRTPSALLACLIMEGIVDVRILVGRSEMNANISKLYHEKAGVFVDEYGDAVGFRGSFNETYKGLSNDGNIESIDVFQSWDGGKDARRVENIRISFDKLWNGEYDSIDVYDLPDQIKKAIKEATLGKKWQELIEEITVTRSNTEKWAPDKKHKQITLKKHQINALEGWAKQGYRAIYQGCTGCGKTIIAISAIRHMLEKKRTVLVLVPSKILLYHWQAEIRRVIADMDIKFLLCGDNNNAWRENGTLHSWTGPSSRQLRVVIAMMDTAVSQDFLNMLRQGEHLFVVADEVHRMGSPMRRRFFEIDAGSRLGLSATPKRYGDKEGTDALIDYFGNILEPPYTLEDAINDKVLTPYFYYPRQVELTAQEQDDWDELTKRIQKHYAMAMNNGSNPADDSFLQNMRIQRARIIKKASNKKQLAIDIIRENYKPGQKWIVYCEDIEQLVELRNELRDTGYDAYAYYAEMPGDKEETLDYFGRQGGILVSIKCLDEGVDIPSTTHALVLASSKNPREFIQRRGRILRKADKKYLAHLYDVIAVPAMRDIENDKSLTIVTSELARAIEFGKHAENPACITDLRIMMQHFGVNYKDVVEGGIEEDEE